MWSWLFRKQQHLENKYGKTDYSASSEMLHEEKKNMASKQVERGKEETPSCDDIAFCHFRNTKKKSLQRNYAHGC